MKRAVTTSSNSMSMNIGSHSGNVPLNHMMTLQQQYLLGSGDDTNNIIYLKRDYYTLSYSFAYF